MINRCGSRLRCQMRRYPTLPAPKHRLAPKWRRCFGGRPALTRLRRPPLVEPALRLDVAQRAFVEPGLQEERQRLPDRRPGPDAEMGHDGVAVEIGPDRA